MRACDICLVLSFDQKPTNQTASAIFFMISKIFPRFQLSSLCVHCSSSCSFVCEKEYFGHIFRGLDGSCIRKLLKYIGSFCWCSQSRRVRWKQNSRTSRAMIFHCAQRTGKTTRLNMTQSTWIENDEKNDGKNMKKHFDQLYQTFYSTDAQYGNWWWWLFCLHHIRNRAASSYPKLMWTFTLAW